MRAMLDDVEDGADVDAARIYATGFSNGASFTARLAVELSDRFAAAAWVGGGLDAAYVPTRNLPVAMVAGQCDDKVAEGLGVPIDRAACVAGAPGGGGLPLDPADWPGVAGLASFVSVHLETFGLAAEPDALHAEPTFGQATWRTPVPGNFAGNRLSMTVLGGTTHQYPRCDTVRCNNPLGWSAADRFWQLFSGYALTACAVP